MAGRNPSRLSGWALALALGFGTLACSESIPQPDREAMARSDLDAIVEALEAYRAANGEWPDALEPLVRPDANGQHFLTAGTSAIYDPWGRAYDYELSGDDYRLGTLGNDGAPGGTGADADLDSRDAPAPPAE